MHETKLSIDLRLYAKIFVAADHQQPNASNNSALQLVGINQLNVLHSTRTLCKRKRVNMTTTGREDETLEKIMDARKKVKNN